MLSGWSWPTSTLSSGYLRLCRNFSRFSVEIYFFCRPTATFLRCNFRLRHSWKLRLLRTMHFSVLAHTRDIFLVNDRSLGISIVLCYQKENFRLPHTQASTKKRSAENRVLVDSTFRDYYSRSFPSRDLETRSYTVASSPKTAVRPRCPLIRRIYHRLCDIRPWSFR